MKRTDWGIWAFLLFLLGLIAGAIGVSNVENSPRMANPSASVTAVVGPHGYTPYGH